MAKQLSMATIPLCFEFFRCRVDVLPELIFTQYDQHCSILLAEFNMSTPLIASSKQRMWKLLAERRRRIHPELIASKFKT